MDIVLNTPGTMANMPIPEITPTVSRLQARPLTTGSAFGNGRKPSLVAGAWSRFRQYSPEQRKAGADILNAHVLIVEIMMSNITQKYIYDVSSMLKERGLMRHNLKRRANELSQVSTDLMKRCNLHDKAQVRAFTTPIYPGLADSFIEWGGTLTQKLQNIFWNTYKEKINLIYFATKNALDKCRVKQSDLVTNMEMVSMLCTTGIEFYECMSYKIDSMMNGIGSVKRIKNRHNEKMLGAVKDMLRDMIGNLVIPEKEGKDVRTLTAQFQRELTGEDLMKMVEGGVTSLKMEFIEYVIANLRIKQATNGFSINDYRTLLIRMGSKKNVRILLNEISAIPLPETSDYDLYDLMETLPDSGTERENAIGTFRRSCLEERIRIIPETKEEVTLRKLRQEVYRNNGTLSMLTLRYLYNVFGTKKAMAAYLSRGGVEVMGRTIRSLKNIKVSQLSLKNGIRYKMNVGIGIRAVCEKRGYTLEQFAAMTEVSKEAFLELEAMDDIANYPNAERPVGKLIKDVSEIVGIDPRYILFASLQETREKGQLPDVFKKLFREMEKIYNPKQEDENEE